MQERARFVALKRARLCTPLHDFDGARYRRGRVFSATSGRQIGWAGHGSGRKSDRDRRGCGARANPRRSLARSDCSNEGDNAMTRVGIIDPVCDRSCDLANADARFPR